MGARALHRLAPLNDQDALLLLEGAVEQGWVTDTEVALSSRARARAARPSMVRIRSGHGAIDETCCAGTCCGCAACTAVIK